VVLGVENGDDRALGSCRRSARTRSRIMSIAPAAGAPAESVLLRTRRDGPCRSQSRVALTVDRRAWSIAATSGSGGKLGSETAAPGSPAGIGSRAITRERAIPERRPMNAQLSPPRCGRSGKVTSCGFRRVPSHRKREGNSLDQPEVLEEVAVGDQARPWVCPSCRSCRAVRPRASGSRSRCGSMGLEPLRSTDGRDRRWNGDRSL